MAMTPQQKMIRLAALIQQEVQDAAGAGLKAGTIFLANRIKETISVPAPRRAIRGPGNSIVGYRATKPAIKGDPIRKLSGRARSSVTSEMRGTLLGVVGLNARSEKGFNYPWFHEVKRPESPRSGLHPFIKPTLLKYKQDIMTIVGSSVKITGV